MLKGKFRRLKYLDVNDISSVPDMILAACALHNFILQNDNETADLENIANTDDSLNADEEDMTMTDTDTRSNSSVASKKNAMK